MISPKKKNSGLKIPFRAISIIPLEKVAQKKIPIVATIIIVLREATLEPIEELRKLTASLLTPTIRSAMAKINRSITIIR
jgi:hypothetical protein